MSEGASTKGTVAMLSGDLLFASKVKSAAVNAGWDFFLGGNLPPEGSDKVCMVILDLSTRSGLTPTIKEQCATRCPDAKLMAYGPHVHVGKLKAARAAGIDRVLTNGQFDASLSNLFA